MLWDPSRNVAAHTFGFATLFQRTSLKHALYYMATTLISTAVPRFKALNHWQVPLELVLKECTQLTWPNPLFSLLIA